MDDRSQPELLPGRATPEGTARFEKRFSQLSGHFRRPDDLWLSSIALGLRRGQPGGVDDLLYRSAISECLEGGINLFDTALSDRSHTSERALGRALARAFAEGQCARDEVVVVTKGGDLSLDPDAIGRGVHPQRELQALYVDTGLVDPAQVIHGNCIAPRFLRDQIDRSRANLGLETIDAYLIQEPELHLRALGPGVFRQTIREVFEMFEAAVREGVIAAYGVCTWSGFLVPHTEREHLSLVDMFEAALEVGSADHHFRFVQLPYGLAMGEGSGLASQLGPDGRSAAVLDSLQNTGTAVLASAPLFGGRLVGHVPKEIREAFPGTRTDAHAALHFVRSTAGVTSAVVGMRDPEHVDENLDLCKIPPSDPRVTEELFRRFSQ